MGSPASVLTDPETSLGKRLFIELRSVLEMLYRIVFNYVIFVECSQYKDSET